MLLDGRVNVHVLREVDGNDFGLDFEVAFWCGGNVEKGVSDMFLKMVYITKINNCLPMPRATSLSLSSERLISTTFSPPRANSRAYALPMPSVAPVMTAEIRTNSYFF